MDFYPSKTNDRLNRRRFNPETIAGRVMVNPRYPIRELAKVAPWWCARCVGSHTFPRVRCDSGAFQDIGKARYLPWTALAAQLRMEEQFRWYLGDETFHFDVVFIYDNPAGVDEAIIEGKKVKVRGTETSAALAIADTITAARYYATRRADIRGRIGWVGQGIDAEQYATCVAAMLPLMQPGDVFGFGGFCIWGRMPRRMTETAQETIAQIVPMVRATGITELHLLGVMYAPGVRWAAEFVRETNEAATPRILLATDGSGPEQAGTVSGRIYRDGRQTDGGYRKEDKYRRYHPCDLALQNIRDYHDWASSLS